MSKRSGNSVDIWQRSREENTVGNIPNIGNKWNPYLILVCLCKSTSHKTHMYNSNVRQRCGSGQKVLGLSSLTVVSPLFRFISPFGCNRNYPSWNLKIQNLLLIDFACNSKKQSPQKCLCRIGYHPSNYIIEDLGHSRSLSLMGYPLEKLFRCCF